MAYKAIIAGATGLIGSKLLQILLNEQEYSEVTILVRKDTGIKHKKLTEVIIDFNKLNEYAENIKGHAVFCCLGTTQKQTPDKIEYRRIEHDYPVKLAQLAAKNGVEQFHFVSSVGADENSSSFYLKNKGDAEKEIGIAGFKMLNIYRPSLLTGERKEFRLIEKMAAGLMYVVNPLLMGGLKKYRSIPAKTVAMAMFKQSITNNEGTFIHPSDQIKQIA